MAVATVVKIIDRQRRGAAQDKDLALRFRYLFYGFWCVLYTELYRFSLMNGPGEALLGDFAVRFYAGPYRWWPTFRSTLGSGDSKIGRGGPAACGRG